MATCKKTTCTKLVLDWLVELDDFATRNQIVEGAAVTSSQVTATLHDLKKYKAIDVMDVDGVLWFYATADRDNRTYKRDEIKDGITRNRKPKRTMLATHGVNGLDSKT